MAGVGIDLLEIERMQRALARRPRLAERLFTPAERAARSPAQLAARFCAKEAVVKALALDVFRPHEIEILGGASGPPRVALHGATADVARARGVHVEVSITHARDTAGAVAVAWPAVAP